jgi:bla regulator protein BlaR1
MSALAFNLFSASLLVVLVLLVRRPVAAAFGARAAYALWLAPLLRLVMPPLPSVSVPVPAGEGGTIYWAQVVAPAAEAALPVVNVLLIVWIAGALAMLAWHLVVHTRFVRRALAVGTPLMVDGVTVDVVATPAVEGPMATGLAHQLILVPMDFEDRFTPEQRTFALLHEQLHHRRGDIWASAAALVAASALWFNPFAHVALGAFRRDMEAACDASLVARTGRDQVPTYAETILASAARPVPRSLCALTSIDELKGRLIMLNANHGAVRKLAGLLLSGGFAAAGLAIAAPASADEPKKETRKEIRTVIVTNDSTGKGGATWDGDKLKTDCPGTMTVVESGPSGTEQKREQQKIVLCTKGGTPEETAKALENVIETVNANDEMSAAAKADLTAKLKARIAEIRAGK